MIIIIKVICYSIKGLIMSKFVLFIAMFFISSLAGVFAQTNEEINDFEQFISNFRIAVDKYTLAKKGKKETPVLLGKVLTFYNDPVIRKSDNWGEITVDTLDMKTLFSSETIYVPIIPPENMRFGQRLSEDYGENGNTTKSLRYDNEEEYDLDKDYFYYQVVKNGPVSWEEGFKVKKIDGKLVIYEVFYREF